MAKKSKGPLIGVILAVFFAMMGVAVLPTTLILVVGLVPSAVAFFADTSRERTLGMTVLTLNIAGILPLLLKLWHQGHTNQQALDILMNPMMLLFILVPSGCGWLLYQYMPYLVIGIMRRKAESRIKTLEKYQEDLVEQWGPTVTGATDSVTSEALPVPETSVPAQ